MESQVTRQMQQTINMLDEITSKYAQHGEILQQLQEANSEVKIRLEKLERGGGGPSAPGSTAAPSMDGSRRLALAIGGWDPDQDAKTTNGANFATSARASATVILAMTHERFYHRCVKPSRK